MEIVGSAIAALGRGDVASVLELFDPDVEFDLSQRLLDPIVLHGPEGARQSFGDLEGAFRAVDASEDELLDFGDDVLWLGAARFQGRRSDAGVSAHGALLWTVRDGNVVRFRFFQTKADALQALSSSS